MELDKDDPFTGILVAFMFATQVTVHSSTTKATPSQLVFSRDAIVNLPFKADWESIRESKQK